LSATPPTSTRAATHQSRAAEDHDRHDDRDMNRNTQLFPFSWIVKALV
jgi:hypothetical protein